MCVVDDLLGTGFWFWLLPEAIVDLGGSAALIIVAVMRCVGVNVAGYKR